MRYTNETKNNIRSTRNDINTIILNFGPQHPAAHGILKICLSISGEIITRADLQFGLLHRGSEKLCETRSINQIVPYFDRMDYVANLIQEHAAVASIESLTSKVVSSGIGLYRVFFDELSRVLNHLLTMSAICLDMGSMGPIFWAFEERELIMELFERVSGARMHTAMYRPFTVSTDYLYSSIIRDSIFLIRRSSRIISGAFLGLINNRAFRSRCSGVGVFSMTKLENYGITGVIGRASGVLIDSRLGLGCKAYSIYPTVSFNTFVGKNGDCYDRFIVRSRELFESFNIIIQLLSKLSTYRDTSYVKSRSKFCSMEGVITHFKAQSGFSEALGGVGLSVVESPKGLLSVMCVSNYTTTPYRIQLKSPVAANLHLLSTAANGYTFADFVSTFCSLDVVLGEIDR